MVSAIYIMAAGLIVYGLVYRFYVRWFSEKVIQEDAKRPTPAHVYMDGVEFFPSNKYVMLGWHSKSITALGPVTGPALAIVWGWLPGFLWVLIGNSLIGWIHDYTSLATSARNEGASLGPLVHQIISPRARIALVGFLLFYTLLIFAAFVGALSPVVVANPAGSLAFYVVAIVGPLSGWLIFKRKVNVLAVTIGALVAIVLGIYVTQMVFKEPITAGINVLLPTPQLKEDFWIGTMLLFSFLGAVLPIWTFAMPINYLAFYLFLSATVGIVVSSFLWRPEFVAPAFTSLFVGLPMGAGQGLFLYTFPLWPLLFVTIACGACSGWHGLFGSSLSAKQVDKETDLHFIGGGSMLLEGIVALTAVSATAILAPPLPAALGRYIQGGARYLSNIFGEGIGLDPSFAVGFMTIIGMVLGLTLTQLALRFSRLALSELVPARPLKNIYVAAIIMAVFGFLLTSGRTLPGGLWGFIWILFGGTNQFLAGTCLLAASLWLYKAKKPSMYTGIPMIFMMVTTIVALAYTAFATFDVGLFPPPLATGAARPWYFSVGSLLAGVIAVIMLLLGFVVVGDGYGAFRRYRAERMGLPSPTMTGASFTATVRPTADPVKVVE